MFDKRGLVRIGSLVRKAKLILGNSVSSQYPRCASILLSLIGPAIPPKTCCSFISKSNARMIDYSHDVPLKSPALILDRLRSMSRAIRDPQDVITPARQTISHAILLPLINELLMRGIKDLRALISCIIVLAVCHSQPILSASDKSSLNNGIIIL